MLASWLLAPRTRGCRVLVCVLTSCVCLIEAETQLQGSVPTHPSTHLRGWRGEASPSVLPSRLQEGTSPSLPRETGVRGGPRRGVGSLPLPPLLCKVAFHRCSESQLASVPSGNK